MKKIISLILVLIFVSCKKELPNNIKSAISNCEFGYSLGKINDSIILNLTVNKIDELSIDSIGDLLSTNDYYQEKYTKSEQELEKILMYNPEYSDYNEVLNKEQPYHYKDLLKYSHNIDYLNKRYIVLLNK